MPMNPLDALRKVRSIGPPRGPQPVAGPPEPMAKPPAPPSAFTTVPDVGDPNIPDFGGTDAVVNDDPYIGFKAQGQMDIDPRTTPSVLAGLKAAGGMDDPSIKLYTLQDKLKDEYEQNLSKGRIDTGPYRYSTGTTPADLLQVNRDIAESLPEQYKAQKLDEAQKQYEARMGGFGGPQQQAQYGRAQEAAKIGAPVDVAKIQAGSAENVQRLKDQGYEDFFNKLAMMGVQAPGTTIQGPGGVRYSSAPVSPGAATTGEKSLEQLQAELNRYQNPKWDDIVLKMTPETDRLQHISDIQGRIAAIQGRVGGRPQGQSQSMRYVAPGTRDRINGVPVVWDGHGWAAEGQ